MSRKRKRVIGTTEDAISRAERELGRTLPPSFRRWLLANNGLGIEDITIFPVLDDRDPRRTWDSIVRKYRENWMAWLQNFERPEGAFDHLLPFAEFGTGDYYCFDYRAAASGEAPVVRWSHETGETDFRARDFQSFEAAARGGVYEYD